MMGEMVMRITERDEEILNFINEFGVCHIEHISCKWGIKKRRAYQIMERLKKAKLVDHERVLYKGYGVYWIHKSIQYSLKMPRVKKVGEEQHALKIIDVYLRLIERFPGSEWISERQLTKQKVIRRMGSYGHLLDGLLMLPNGKKIGIEVELTLKGTDRLKTIFKGFLTADLDEVWYYCAPEIISTLQRIVLTLKVDSIIKIYSIETFLS
jgi:predicted transcriptional regulator